MSKLKLDQNKTLRFSCSTFEPNLETFDLKYSFIFYIPKVLFEL